MAYWILKTEPSVYSFEMLEKDRQTDWTGVRNFQARNYLREMKVGDIVFIYHTGEEKMIIGIGKILKEAFADPTATSGDWSAVQVGAVASCQRPVSLDEIRNTHGLSVMPLVSHPRLSVCPMTDIQAHMILKIAKTDV
ncbi:EVE domain-containing protein [Candidatus Uhrbacteria bacterium]|nr:EVE domain-containing protein [Candidatus Uhrbacteria bacterium]